jgi:hypothetical protein
MGVKRFYSTKDNTITNAFKAGLTIRGTGSNMGESDILEVYSIYGQASSASSEKSRILIDFPILTTIAQSRDSGELPTSGTDNLSFYLRLYNAEHSQTLPKQFTLVVAQASSSWNEGTGLDMDEFSDSGYSNWIYRSSSAPWVDEGGDILSGSADTTGSQLFELGTEDLLINVTPIVEDWLSGDSSSNGFAVFLTSSQETATESYYTKKFFARNSEFHMKRPCLEARWNSSRGDDSETFYKSSSLAPAADNLNTLYLYNKIRGQLVDIPSVAQGEILVSVHETVGTPALPLPVGGGVVAGADTNVTGSWASTGIYEATFAMSHSISSFVPVWKTNTEEFHTGSSITVNSFDSQDYYPDREYIFKIKNLKKSYSEDEKMRLRLFVRHKNWCPTNYTVSNTTASNEILEDVFWKVERVVDKFDIIDYGTGSTQHTLLSYDSEGNYFDFDTSILEKGYQYAFKFIYNIAGEYHEAKNEFRFRVE